MGIFDKLRKPKMIDSRVYGKFPEFVSEEKLPDDFITLQNMGRYYKINYDHSKRDYQKAFVIYNKMVRMDTQRQYMYLRRSLGELYALGRGVAKDTDRGYALMNEWYQHILMTGNTLSEIGSELANCIADGCMSWKQLLELAWQRMKQDYQNYNEPIGAAMIVNLEAFWKNREQQTANGWSNLEYCQYLYRTYNDPFAQFCLDRKVTDFAQGDTMLYESAGNGCIFASGYLMYKLNLTSNEAELSQRIKNRQLMEQQLLQTQQKAEEYMQMEVEDFLK